jgi:hypothetical protein
MIENPAKPETYLQKYRRLSSRLDYYPSGPAMSAIKHMKLSSPGRATQVILDKLVCAGFEHLAQAERDISGK